jgi:hypothetical protein
MKRSSILAVLALLVVAGSAGAVDTIPVAYRVRWSPYVFGLICGDVRYSPYAFDYNHSGLVSGYLYYSPYAFGYGRTGLVPVNVRYSPYAFGYGRSGLVTDTWCSYGYAMSCGLDYDDGQTNCSTPGLPYSSYGQITNYYASQNTAKTGAQTHRQADAAAKATAAGNTDSRQDARQLITKFLRDRNIKFRTDRLLKIDNNTISIDFLLNDSNIIIKYWDSAAILSLDDNKRKSYERYLESWKEFAGQHRQTGGAIYQIVSAEAEKINAALAALNLPAVNRQKVYAADEQITAAASR